METQQINRLIDLLNKRSDKIESIQNFEDHFDKFVRYTLMNVVEKVNDVLTPKTNESFRIFLENPYETSKARYSIMVQLMSEQYRKNSFQFDNSKNLPSLIFEGDEFTGSVKVWTIFKNKKFGSYYDIDKLDESKTFDILLEFIDDIYKN